MNNELTEQEVLEALSHVVINLVKQGNEEIVIKTITETYKALILKTCGEAYEKGLRDMADDETIADKAIAKFREQRQTLKEL